MDIQDGIIHGMSLVAARISHQFCNGIKENTMTTNNHPAHGPLSLDRLHQIRETLSKASAQSDGGNLGYAMADAVKVIDGAIAAFGTEPVAYMTYKGYLLHAADPKLAEYSDPTPLYTAPPAPVSVPAAMEMDDDFDSAFEHGKAVGWNACRTAMLQGGNHAEQHLDMVGLSGDTNEKGKDGTLINEGTMPVTQIKPVADLYGITSPNGSETTFTFDAGEASSFAKGGWTVQEYVELERYQEAVAGNSPVTPDGCIPVSDHSMLPPLEYLDTVKFNADCAIQDPESIYTNEFFLSLDEVFGEMGNYSEPVQAKAVSMLIAEVFRLRGYSRAAPHQEAKSALEHGMQRYAGAMQKLSEGDK